MPTHAISQADEQTPLLAGHAVDRPPKLRDLLKRSSRNFADYLAVSPRLEDASLPGDGDYDSALKDELCSEGSHAQTWTRNFESIDWLHDSVKDSVRRRKIRLLPGWRGKVHYQLDRGQGWIVVLLVGVCSAFIAFAIITLERWLFDLKDGHCSTNWRHNKARCCPGSEVADQTAYTSRMGLSSYQLSTWSKNSVEACTSWKTWSETLGKVNNSWVNYATSLLIALCLAVTASVLTVYLTSSESVQSSKDQLVVSVPETATSNMDSASKEERLYHPPPRKTMYFAAGSGIPEIKSVLGGFVIRGYLGGFTLGVKSVGLALSVASGLSLGKEGPFVHICSCIGNLISRGFPKYDQNEAKRREILSAACAAGVAVSFGAPVGGVLFSLEETSYYFPPKTIIRSFIAAASAAMVLKSLNPFNNGKIVLFQVTHTLDYSNPELAGFIALGIFGGVYGAMFCKANLAWASKVRAKTWLGKRPIIEVALITLITVAVSAFNPFTHIGGTELVAEMFAECHSENYSSGLCIKSPSSVLPLVKSLLLALVIKALLTVVTFGIKVPAGIFIPTLAIGALLGRSCGLLINLTYSKHPNWPIFSSCLAKFHPDIGFDQACVQPGVWAMVGAAGTLAGVTRTTVSLAVIMFELTSTLNYVVPVMLSVLAAKTVADALEPSSIYDLVLQFANLPFLDAKVEITHCARPADVMDSDAIIIDLQEDNTLASIRQKLHSVETSTRSQGLIVLNGRRLIGYLAAKDLAVGLSKKLQCDGSMPATFKRPSSDVSQFSALPTPHNCDFGSLVDMSPLIVTINSPMEILQELFVKLGVKYLIVVDENYCYCGIINKEHWLGYLQYAEKKHGESGHRPQGSAA